MIHVSQLAPDGQWDQTMLFDLFANKLYPTGLEFSHRLGYVRRGAKGSIVIIPGRYWSKERDYAQINDALMHYEWVLAIRTSDEEDSFDIERIAHANIKWWVQTPKAGVFYDASDAPNVIHDIAQVLPLTHLVDGLSGAIASARRPEYFT